MTEQEKIALLTKLVDGAINTADPNCSKTATQKANRTAKQMLTVLLDRKPTEEEIKQVMGWD